ncbi:13970_t:CDS:2 [Entrophospora sp. SA101]|nr:13970_t:CDS:2 [Entrophospora sp. SA101]
MRKTIAKAKLENKEGEFECSFGKNLLENYSEAKKVCFLKCLAGAQGRFRCQQIEFLNNNEEKFVEENSKTLIVQKEKEDEIKELNEKQKIVCQLALTGQNVCFLGEAGTGKSFLLKHLIKLLSEEYEEELVITSYTGRTAINIRGKTLHSFAGIGVAGECKILIIDEISMLDGNLFDKLEIIARQIKRVEQPFGGIQLIVCVHLNQIYRQQDNKIINLLQEVRAGNLSAAKVNQINQQELAKLATSSITYCARDKEKRAHTLSILTKDCLAPEKLELKVGAQVMLTINQFDRKLVNGSQGVIISFKEEEAGLRITEAIGFNPELKHPEPEYQDLYLLRGKRKKDQFLRRVRYDLNINSHIELAPHTLRRCFATYNLLAGMPLNILQKFLGHSRVSTTALYIKDSDLANLLKFKPI